MSPSCITGRSPLTSIPTPQPSLQPFLLSMRSLDNAWTSVLLIWRDWTACMTVVSDCEDKLHLCKGISGGGLTNDFEKWWGHVCYNGPGAHVTNWPKTVFVAETHTLLDQCAFEQINICGMIQNENDNADWVQTLSSAEEQDHTLGGQCRGTEPEADFCLLTQKIWHLLGAYTHWPFLFRNIHHT